MSTWDEVMNVYGNEISSASDEYVKASNILPYSITEIKAVFPEDELEEVGKFMKEMKEAAADNNKKADIIGNYREVAVKLLKLAKIVL